MVLLNPIDLKEIEMVEGFLFTSGKIYLVRNNRIIFRIEHKKKQVVAFWMLLSTIPVR